MAQTNIPAGSPLARKVYGAALFSRIIQAETTYKNLTGPAPKQSDAESKLKGQTAADMPIVRVTDLSKQAGGSVSVDCFDTISGKPIVGDRNAEGQGEKLSSSSIDIAIDQFTKVVDVGGRMAQQRTLNNLRGIAFANLTGYFPRLKTQTALIHAAGARGSMVGRDWIVPLESDTDYKDIMVNNVLAPTYNRHFVINGTGLTAGGQQLGSIATTDVWKLSHIDALSLILDDLEFPLQPVKIADDAMRNDDPIKAVLMLTPRQWNQIKTEGGSSNTWRSFIQGAWARTSSGSKHPLFTGEAGVWNGVLVRVAPRYTVRFKTGDSTNIITAANRYTATETSQSIAAGFTGNAGGFAVERAVLLGAQAVADVYGRDASSDYYFSWNERKYNFEKNMEVAGSYMGGMSKLRFKFSDGNGNAEPTDLGAMVIDSAVAI